VKRVRFPIAVPVLALALPAAAAPYVAYVGNVSVHSDSAQAKVMTVDLATQRTVNVSTGLASARAPAWLPDGRRLAFEAIADGFCDVFVCDADGKDRRNLTARSDVWDGSPSAVDAEQVAFLSGLDRSDVWIAELDSGRLRQVTRRPLFRKAPVASPRGDVLAVVAAEALAGAADIHLVPTAGGEPVNLTRGPARYSRPAFSPDGKTLVVSFDGRDIGGASRGVAALPVEGGEPVLLARDGYPLAPLCFSPDGTRIAYTSAATYHTTWVRIMQRDGTPNERIEADRAHIIGWPSFTPDGTALVHQGVYAALYTIRLLDLDTGENTILSPEGEAGVTPVCSPR
jgi:Tol biopolymer transport system component